MSFKRRISSCTELNRKTTYKVRRGKFRFQNEEEIDPQKLFKRSSTTLLRNVNDRPLNMEDCDVIAAAKRFLKYMHEAWRSNRLCDVILLVENGEELLAHKVALGAYSESLTQEFDRYPKNELISLDLQDFSRAVVLDFLNFVYTTKIQVGSHNIRELLTLATELEITILVEICMSDLSDFNVENAIFYYTILEDVDIPELQASIYHFICENFVDIVNGKEFLETSYEQIYALLTDTNILVESELDLFLAIVRWIDYDRAERLVTAPVLLQCVEFYKMSPEVLVAHVEVQSHIFDMIECHMMLYEAMKWHALSRAANNNSNGYAQASQTLNRVTTGQRSGHRSRVKTRQVHSTVGRNLTSSKVITGRSGYASRQPKMGTSVNQGHWFGSAWKGTSHEGNQQSADSTTEYTTLTGTSASEAEEDQQDGRYMVQKDIYLSENQHGNVQNRLTLSSNTPASPSRPFSVPQDYQDLSGMSTSVESMLKPYDASLSTMSPICVGGLDVHSVDSDKPGRCVYQYDSEQNSWNLLTRMPTFRHHHAAVVVAGKLCILGGAIYNKKEPEKLGTATGAVLVYDRGVNQWSEATPMHYQRAYLSAVAYGSKIYAIGGEDESKTKLATIEVYDASFDTWTFLQTLRRGPKIGVAVCVYRNCLWVVGGYNPDRPDGPLLKDVECFDLGLQRWIPKTPLHIPVCHANLVVCMGKMYLVGGRTQNPEDGALISLKSVYEYDDMSETWRHASDMSIARHDCATSVIGTRLYIMGGMQTHRNMCLDSVECFDTHTYTWLHNVASLPQPAAGLASCTL